MTKRRSYDDEFRANAVVMLESQGYPQIKGALTAVSRQLSVPAMTLSRWFRGTNNPPPNKVVNEKRGDLKDLLNKELQAVLEDLPHKRPDADYRALITATGVLVDKIQLLEGKPTQNVEGGITFKVVYVD